ncbi:hypothetical protein LTR86_007977 [Recurvomyces mirabilis]|nr:hypothetical protein LTR86_007977 [Recurvomyces mirabilis]
MLLSTSLAGRSQCLRIQLHHILLELGRRRSSQGSIAARSFTDSTRIRQEPVLDDGEPEQHTQLRIYRDDGSRRDRVVGRPGRRQRTSSARLKTTSLGRPAEVVVLRDVADDVGAPRQITVPFSGGGAEQMEAVASARAPRSEHEEVMTSIDLLRPQDTVMEAEEIKQLKQQLTRGYNAEQLRNYLFHHTTPLSGTVQSTGTIDAAGASTTIPITMWQSGRTSIEQRVGRIPYGRNELEKKKPLLAQEIIRNAWHLTTEEEVHQVGELEMYVKSWQTAYLFDLKRGKLQQFETLFESPLLARATTVRPYRKDDIVRITGRKADAEEVARYIQAGLASVQKDHLDLRPFRPLLGTPGWSRQLEQIFHSQDLHYISEKTGSIFRIGDDHRMSIYSAANHPQSTHAKRLLLSLLNLPSTTKTFIYDDVQARSAATAGVKLGEEPQITEWPVMEVHRKHDRQNWYREVLPVAKRAAPTDPKTPSSDSLQITNSPASLGRRTAEFLQELPGLRGRDTNAAQDAAEWTCLDLASLWSARIGSLIVSKANWQERTQLKTQKRHGVEMLDHSAFFVDEAGGKLPLLENFEPDISDQSSSRQNAQQLLVHIQPSPVTAVGLQQLRALPSLVTAFDMSKGSSTNYTHTLEPKFESIVATSARQEVHIPLPNQAADVSFSRSTSFHQLPKAVAQQSGLGHLVNELIVALRTPGAALPSLSNIDIPLPTGVLLGAKEPEQDGEASSTTSYFISHFEHVTTTDLIPLQSPARREGMDPGVRRMAEQWPAWLVLRLREVDAGPLAGRRTEMLLVHRDKTDIDSRSGETEVTKLDSLGRGQDGEAARIVHSDDGEEASKVAVLVKTAVQLTRVMTRGRAGQLRSS